MVGIKREDIQKVVETWGAKEKKDITIGIFGSHSAEDIGVSAKAAGFRTVLVCEKNRDALYTRYSPELFDNTIILDSFKDIIDPGIQDKLNRLNTIFIPNRSFSVYTGYDNIENRFRVPIYGNRFLLRAEERTATNNQYDLLRKAGIRTPKHYKRPEDIDALAIIKIQQKHNPLERAFFYAKDCEDYKMQSRKLIKQDIIDESQLKDARIEEFIIAPRFNANFQSYTLDTLGTIDFAGFEDRIQTNLMGLLNLPARDQLKIDIPIKNEEIGHHGMTMRESKKILVYDAAEKFVETCKKEYPPGIIGLFSLQGAIPEGKDGLEFVVFDVSPRIPGCPCVGPTSPEMRRLSIIHGQKIESPIDLTMLEIREALKTGQLKKIIT
ncbi:DUF1297 domain-containing protein [Candidatus Parcubacteria bacterium]|nr:DUF1297 domain-containing protein [Candidatus Parcubacteria bacterium]